MNNKLICPFCQQELRKIHPTYVICDNCRITGEDKLWQELIRTKKQLGTTDLELDQLNLEKYDIEDELERTRKALEIAVDALKSAHDYYEYCIQRDRDYGGDDINWDCTAMNMDNDISEALEQITALEQKDVK